MVNFLVFLCHPKYQPWSTWGSTLQQKSLLFGSLVCLKEYIDAIMPLIKMLGYVSTTVQGESPAARRCLAGERGSIGNMSSEILSFLHGSTGTQVLGGSFRCIGSRLTATEAQ